VKYSIWETQTAVKHNAQQGLPLLLSLSCYS